MGLLSIGFYRNTPNAKHISFSECVKYPLFRNLFPNNHPDRRTDIPLQNQAQSTWLHFHKVSKNMHRLIKGKEMKIRLVSK